MRDGRDALTERAVVLAGARGSLSETVLRFADIAYDVLAETGVLVDAHPFWEAEWDDPAASTNPRLVEEAKNDGFRL